MMLMCCYHHNGPVHPQENPDTFSLLGTPISYKVAHFTTN